MYLGGGIIRNDAAGWRLEKFGTPLILLICHLGDGKCYSESLADQLIGSAYHFVIHVSSLYKTYVALYVCTYLESSKESYLSPAYYIRTYVCAATMWLVCSAICDIYSMYVAIICNFNVICLQDCKSLCCCGTLPLTAITVGILQIMSLAHKRLFVWHTQQLDQHLFEISHVVNT